MQQKCPFTAYLKGFVNTQSPRHLKGFPFLSKLSLISFPIKDGKFGKTRAKVPGKSNLECWQNCPWFSIVFHCSFFGFSLVFLWFSLFFLIFSLILLWFSIIFMCCSLLVIFFSLVFIGFIWFIFGFHVFSLVFICLWVGFLCFLWLSSVFLLLFIGFHCWPWQTLLKKYV